MPPASKLKLGTLLRHAREDARLSHRGLALKAGRSSSTALRAETGKGTLATFRDLLRPTGWKLVIVGVPPKLGLGRAIAKSRRRAGLTWTDLAARTGLVYESIRDLESDPASSTADTFARVLDALRLRVTLAR